MPRQQFDDDTMRQVIQKHPAEGDYRLAGRLLGADAEQRDKRRVASQLFRFRQRMGLSTSPRRGVEGGALHVLDSAGQNSDQDEPPEERDPIATLRSDLAWLRAQMRIAAADRSHTAVTSQMALVRRMESELDARLAEAAVTDVQDVDQERIAALVRRLPPGLVRKVVGE
jgi:hypothetical protein